MRIGTTPREVLLILCQILERLCAALWVVYLYSFLLHGNLPGNSSPSPPWILSSRESRNLPALYLSSFLAHGLEMQLAAQFILFFISVLCCPKVYYLEHYCFIYFVYFLVVSGKSLYKLGPVYSILSRMKFLFKFLSKDFVSFLLHITLYLNL